MNYGELQEEVWRYLGYPDTTTGTRQDFRKQEIRNALNTAYGAILARCAPAVNFMKRETTIAIVAGTQDYLISDWCQRPLSFWTQDTFAHPIDFNRAMEADRDGSRGSNNVAGALGPYEVTLLPRTTDPAYSGAAGATSGAAVTEAATTVVLSTAGLTLTSAVVGRMLKLNGEDDDYKIMTQDGAHTVTVDKPVKGKLSSTGTGGAGTGYAAASTRWEIGPAGRYKLRFLPSPTDTATVYVRYMAYPRRLIGDSDTPEIQSEMHHLIVEGAMERVTQGKQALEWAQSYEARFKDKIAMLQKSDRDEYPGHRVPRVATLDDYSMHGRVRQVGEDRRRW